MVTPFPQRNSAKMTTNTAASLPTETISITSDFFGVIGVALARDLSTEDKGKRKRAFNDLCKLVALAGLKNDGDILFISLGVAPNGVQHFIFTFKAPVAREPLTPAQAAAWKDEATNPPGA